MLAVVMVFGGAPAGALAGLDLRWLKIPFSLNAGAGHIWQAGDTCTFGSYPQTIAEDRPHRQALNAQTLNRVSYGYYSGSGSYGSMSQSDYMMYADVTYGGNRYRAVRLLLQQPRIHSLRQRL